jgi:hypothetical protein
VAGIGITWPVMRSRLVDCCLLNPAELQRRHPEFTMIHHLARAFFIRNNALAAMQQSGNPPADGGSSQQGAGTPGTPASRPVKARPITPWPSPARPSFAHGGLAQGGLSLSSGIKVIALPQRRVRICTDPADARRTVIAGRFAEVCAALDRLVMEQEAIA